MRALHPLPITQETRSHLAPALNRTLHEVLMTGWQLERAHRNTRGAWFFARHQLFDRVSEHLRGAQAPGEEELPMVGAS